MRILLSGAFSTTTSSVSVNILGPYSVSVQSGDGTVLVEKSVNNGANWDAVSGGEFVTGTASGTADGYGYGELFRLRCSVYTSGSIRYSIIQVA